MFSSRDPRFRRPSGYFVPDRGRVVLSPSFTLSSCFDEAQEPLFFRFLALKEVNFISNSLHPWLSLHLCAPLCICVRGRH